jgi:hypothetical protein
MTDRHVDREWRMVDADELLVPMQTGSFPWSEPASHGGPVVVLYAAGRLRDSHEVQTGYLALDQARVVGIVSQLLAAAWEVGMDVDQIRAEINAEIVQMCIAIVEERRAAESN